MAAKLCEKCCMIDLDALLEESRLEYNLIRLIEPKGHPHWESYNRLARSAKNGCPLCTFFIDNFAQSHMPSMHPAADPGFFLHATKRNPDHENKIGIHEIELHHKGLNPYGSLLCRAGVFVEPGNEDLTSEIFSGQPVAPHADSSDCYATVQRWINECLETHSDCPKHPKAPLPSRVIHVGSFDGSIDPYVYESNHEEGTWLTLSHRWGGVSGIVLNQSSLEGMKNRIPWSDLPKTFQDVITVARKLAVPYVWIDALCILQEVRDDWIRESADMARIFKDCWLNVAALESPNPIVGFLHPRGHRFASIGNWTYDESFENPPAPAIRVAVKSKSSNSDGHIYVRRALLPYRIAMRPPHTLREDDNLHDRVNWLQFRAWIHQETLLSPRTVYYGVEQLYWHCRTWIKEEADVVPVEITLWPSFHSLNSKTFLSLTIPDRNIFRQRSGDDRQPPLEHYSIWTNWLRVMNEYARKTLTIRSDTFPAISGVASEVARITGDTYLAGLWLSDIHRGLLWDGQLGRNQPRTKAEGIYIAPSWSWASTRGPQDVASKLWLYDDISKRNSEDSRVLDKAKLVDWHLEQATEDPFGLLNPGCFLTLTGYQILPSAWTISYEGQSVKLTPPGYSFQPESRTDEDTGQIVLDLKDQTLSDSTWDAGANWTKHFTCLFIAYLPEYLDGSKHRGEKLFWALILQHIGPAPDEYIRIGTTYFGVEAAIYRKGWQETTVTIY